MAIAEDPAQPVVLKAATPESPVSEDPTATGNANVLNVVAETAAHDEAHAKAGLPQMDPTWFASQIFWLLLTFGFLYTAFSKKILPGISSTLEKRRNQIQEDLDFASRLREEAEQTHKEYDALLNDARTRANTLFTQLDDDLKAAAAVKTKALQENARTQIESAEGQLESIKTQSMAEMHSIAAEVASLAANKIIGVTTDIDHAKMLIKNIGKKAA